MLLQAASCWYVCLVIKPKLLLIRNSEGFLCFIE